ncbi:hypothetical protein ACT1U9_04765 [Streptomyces sp. BR1]
MAWSGLARFFAEWGQLGPLPGGRRIGPVVLVRLGLADLLS